MRSRRCEAMTRSAVACSEKASRSEVSQTDEGLALHLHQNKGATVSTSTKRYLPETAPEQIEGSAAEFARRMGWFRTFLLVLIAVYALPLFWLVGHVARSNLHSHVLLIPFVSIYLLHIHRRQLSCRYVAAPTWTVLLGGAGLLSLAAAWVTHGSAEWMSY